MSTPAAAAHKFIGRQSELDALIGAVGSLTPTGGGSLTLIEGDPGIGKTRLARELAASDVTRSVRVIWARGWEAGNAPYFLWTQVLRELLRSGASRGAVPASVEALAGAALPEPRSVDRLVAEDEGERFHLHDSLSRWLMAEALNRPILLMLDDLHAAGPASLHMLHFLARQLATMPLLVVGTRRPMLRRREDGVAEALASLAREASVLHLGGLDHAQSRALVAEMLGRMPDDEWASELHRLSGGSPLLLEQLVRSAASRRDDAESRSSARLARATPSTAMQEIVRSRIDGLSAAVREIVQAAAVLGDEFDATSLAAMTHGDVPAVADAIDTGLGAHLFAPSENARAKFTFSHDLFQEFVYDGLGDLERARLHRSAGEARESSDHEDDARHAAEIARHFLAAVEPLRQGSAHDASLAAADRDLLVRTRQHAVRAAQHAHTHTAYEDAVSFYEQGLRVSEVLGNEETASIEILVDLARSRRDAGDVTSARRGVATALERARAAGASELFALAAIAAASMRGETVAAFPERIALLEEARAGLGDMDSAIHALTLSRLAQACYYAGDRHRVETLAKDAVEMARRVGDPAVLGTTLSLLQYTMWGPDTVEERLAISLEAIRVAEELGRPKDALNARKWRLAALLEIGDVAAVDREVEEYARQAEQFRLPSFLWHAEFTRGTRALMSGRLEEVDRRAHRAMQHAERTDQTLNAIQFRGAQEYALRRERGGLADLEPAVRRNVAELPGLPVWRCALALLKAETGRLQDARDAVETGFRADLSDIPKDGNWLPSLSALATVCAETDDTKTAATLYDLLRPYAHRHVVIGNGAVVLGPVSRFLGRLASVLGRSDTADAHFGAAIDFLESVEALQLVARTRLEWATARARRGASAHDSVQDELRRVEAIAHERGMQRLTAQVEALRTSLASPASAEGDAPLADRAAFSDALRRALTQIDRPDLLKQNPLVASDLVRKSHPRASPDEAAQILGDLIRRECELFRRSERDEIYYRILERTYFGRPTKQREAAADLALSYASYRRHHATAISRLEARLWERLGHTSLAASGEG